MLKTFQCFLDIITAENHLSERNQKFRQIMIWEDVERHKNYY